MLSFTFVRWAGESDPRIVFRNVVQRPRHKSTGDLFGQIFVQILKDCYVELTLGFDLQVRLLVSLGIITIWHCSSTSIVQGRLTVLRLIAMLSISMKSWNM